MRALIVEPEAEEELAAAMDWYEDQEPGLGAALLAEVDDMIAGLRRNEAAGLRVPGVPANLPVRRTLLDRFPYAIVFIDYDDKLHIVAIAHHKRRPDYWRSRL